MTKKPAMRDMDGAEVGDVVISMDRVTKSKKKGYKARTAAKRDDGDGVDDFVDALLAGSDDEASDKSKKNKKKKKKSKKAKTEQSKEVEVDNVDGVEYNDDDVQDLYAWDPVDEEEEAEQRQQKKPARQAVAKPASNSVGDGDLIVDEDEVAAAMKAERQKALSLAMLVADDAEKNGNRDLPRDTDDWFNKLDEETNGKAAANQRKRKRATEDKPAIHKEGEGEELESDGDLPTDLVKSRNSASEGGHANKRRATEATKAKAIPKEKKEAIGRFLAIDCEMVGTGFKGSRSVLARVSIVNYYGHVVLDAYVKPEEEVTDYRTWVSGIRRSDLAKKGRPFKEVQEEVAKLFEDRVIIGHAINHDLKALMLTHNPLMIRDTARYSEFKKFSKGNSPSLKKLAASILNINIQDGEHSSVTDAKTTMLLYRKVKDEWERQLAPKRYKVQVKRAKDKERFARLRQEINEQQQRQSQR